MYRFWDSLIKPLLQSLEISTIVEVGAQGGLNTVNLIQYCLESLSADMGSKVLHSIDPFPDFDVGAWQDRYGDMFVFYRELSLGALNKIDSPDVVLLDGDHNWYTVYHELQLLRSRCLKNGWQFPTVFLHDVVWPYARRDLYYDPELIPSEFRHPFSKGGLRPGELELAGASGLNSHLCNAVFEGGRRNGVLTAVEDFLGENKNEYGFVSVGVFNGLGVIFRRELVRENELFAAVIRDFRRSQLIDRVMVDLESERINQVLQIQDLKQARLQQDRLAMEKLKQAGESLRQSTEKLRLLEKEKREELEALQGRLRQIELENQLIKRGLSWRITAPLRMLKKMAQRVIKALSRLQISRCKCGLVGKNPGTVSIPFSDSCDVSQLNFVAKSSIVVFIQCHQEQFEQVVNALSNIPYNFSLQLKIAGGQDVAKIEERLRQELMHLDQVVVSTVVDGSAKQVVDWANFIHELSSFDLVCFGDYLAYHRSGKKELFLLSLHDLLGSLISVGKIIELLETDGGLQLLYPCDASKADPSLETALARSVGAVSLEFLARTGRRELLKHRMFWAKSAAVIAVLAGEDGKGRWEEKRLVLKAVGNSILSHLPNSARHRLRVAKYRLNVGFQGRCYYTTERPFPPRSVELLSRKIGEYQAEKKGCNKIVVYTAIVGDYDSLMPPENFDSDIDYVCFSDKPRNGFGVFEIRPLDYFHLDVVKTARYVKTHPHRLLSDYEIAIWIDSNVLIRGELKKYVDLVKASGMSFGGIVHPLRDSIFQEATECKLRAKDDLSVIDRQIRCYASAGYTEQRLIESNFFIALLGDKKLQKALDFWWNEIEIHSRRDQLSHGYAFRKAGVEWCSLFENRMSVRNHNDFAIFPHGLNNGHQIDRQFFSLWPLTDPYTFVPSAASGNDRWQGVKSKKIDIIVCVHNALADVKNCLVSVQETLLDYHRLIIVDDCSDQETASFLKEFVVGESRAVLLRSDQPLRYTRAVNLGLRNSDADFVILLNSDTIVSADWSLKLAEVAFIHPLVGIVGPLSNAASHQSIPDTRGTKNQTAVNELPPAMGIFEVNQRLEAVSMPALFPSVPLVHGFCFGIRREVIDAIGLMDEESFPQGYGEENDYCFRAAAAGFDLKIATHTYVYHAKSKSYSGSTRLKINKDSQAVLRKLHSSTKVRTAVQIMEQHPLLQKLRAEALSWYAPKSNGSGGQCVNQS